MITFVIMVYNGPGVIMETRFADVLPPAHSREGYYSRTPSRKAQLRGIARDSESARTRAGAGLGRQLELELEAVTAASSGQ